MSAAQPDIGHQARHALDVDFALRRRRPSPLGLLLLAAGLLAVLAVALDYVDAQDTLAQVEQRQQRLARQLRPATAAAARPRVAASGPARDEVQAVATVQAQLHLPWDALLTGLEQLADPAVAVLGVEGQGAARTLRLSGEARSMADVVAYIERLRVLPQIQSATLSGHELRQAGAVEVVRFVLDVRWRQAS